MQSMSNYVRIAHANASDIYISNYNFIIKGKKCWNEKNEINEFYLKCDKTKINEEKEKFMFVDVCPSFRYFYFSVIN